MEFLTMQAHKQLQGEEKPHKPFLQFTSLELRKLMIKGLEFGAKGSRGTLPAFACTSRGNPRALLTRKHICMR
ncbi:hypothetical protein V6Z12_D01G079200 [Gossypium hirsutum]